MIYSVFGIETSGTGQFVWAFGVMKIVVRSDFASPHLLCRVMIQWHVIRVHALPSPSLRRSIPFFHLICTFAVEVAIAILNIPRYSSNPSPLDLHKNKSAEKHTPPMRIINDPTQHDDLHRYGHPNTYLKQMLRSRHWPGVIPLINTLPLLWPIYDDL